MDKNHIASVETLCWKDARQQVREVNPTLFKIIDELNPDKRFLLFKAKYPFGSKIAAHGEVYMPTKTGTVEPLHSSDNIRNEIKVNLSSRNIPTMLILKNSTEIFYEMSDRIISVCLSTPGKFIGLWDKLDPSGKSYVKWIWTLVSGARTLYLLPRLSNIVGHKELRKKYHVTSHAPKSYNDHWNVFVQIANSSDFNHEWHSEILFFSESWLEMAKKDPAWRVFYDYIFNEAWQEMGYWRSKVTFEIVWENFVSQIMNINAKPNLYLAYIVKQLILTGIGVLPALTVATDDLAAPVSSLQKVYLEDYKLKDYMPIFMHPHLFAPDDKYPTYYSLQYPNLLETIPITQNMPSVLSSMPDIQYLMESFKSESIKSNIAEATPIYDFCEKVQLDYFHNREEKQNNILSTSKLVLEDERLQPIPAYKKNKAFPEASSIISGCIRFKNTNLKE